MKHLSRILALLLAAALLCTGLSLAAEEAASPLPDDTQPSVEETPEEEAPAEDPIPAGWAHDALQFAVAHNLMTLETLEPTRAATRAELAKMVVTLFGPTDAAPLDGFTDVAADAWHAPYLAQAVSMGVLYGSDDGKLNPEATVTREQACAMLARAFGLAGGTAADLTAFSDYPFVSSWAVSSVGAMVRAGFLNGSSGKLRPQDTISRQELAQLFYNMTGVIAQTADALPQSGKALLQAPPARLSNQTIDGDLILACQASETLTLQNIRVTGRLVLRGAPNITLQNVTAAEVALCDPCTLTVQSGSLGDVIVLRDGTTVEGRCKRLALSADATLARGSAEAAVLCGGDLTIAAGAAVQDAEILPYASGTSLTVDGRLNTLTVGAKNVQVRGSGTLSQALVHKSGAQIDTANTTVTEELDAGLVGLTVTSDLVEPTPEAPTASFTYTFAGVSTEHCAGSETGVRYCSVQLLVDGAAVRTLQYVPLSDGFQQQLTHKFSYRKGMKNSAEITLRVLYDGEVVTSTKTIALHNYDDAYYDELARKNLKEAAMTVKTLEVEATVRYQTSLYSYMGLSGYLRTLPAGTTCIYDCYYGSLSGRIRLSDGTVGWVSLGALNISTKNYVIADYSTEVKEAFVNYNAYKSSTDRLVWVSLKTQRVNVFRNSSGTWKLEKSFSVCTGKNATPTVAGVFSYSSRTDIWDFGSYYVRRPMIFNGGHAFHSRTYVKSTGGLLDPTIGRPASHGCVRMYDEDVNWLWDHLQFGTTVVVF